MTHLAKLLYFSKVVYIYSRSEDRIIFISWVLERQKVDKKGTKRSEKRSGKKAKRRKGENKKEWKEFASLIWAPFWENEFAVVGDFAKGHNLSVLGGFVKGHNLPSGLNLVQPFFMSFNIIRTPW